MPCRLKRLRLQLFGCEENSTWIGQVSLGTYKNLDNSGYCFITYFDGLLIVGEEGGILDNG